MFALVDCNSFFCSVEKAFHPGLDGKPVVVLSSNDGCIVALTPEAKRAGLHRGDPLFKVQDIVERHGVTVFSSNMYLYAAMSRRVTAILRKSVQCVENYSIDESFCDLSGYAGLHDVEALMRDTAARIRLWTDIPVSVGIAPTKTLAKMGSKFAKQYKGYRGVCIIDTEEKRRKALQLFDLADVWGIGRHTLEKLQCLGIRTPLEFADKSRQWVRTHLTKPGMQTWLELNGTPCIDTSEVVRNKSVCTSRSFGEPAGDLASLRAAVATFASGCANKLRGQSARARTVTVFIASNRFREDLPQYSNAATLPLPLPTNDTMELADAALKALAEIFREGVLYKKAGVILSDIEPDDSLQLALFDPVRNRPKRSCLMQAMDDINHRYGLKTLHLAIEGGNGQKWKSKCERRSPNYLTDIRELLVVKA